MSTFNGLGTSLRGWNHQRDGTAFATSWLVFSYLPVVPLRRYHVRVLTDFENEPFVPVSTEKGWFAGGISWRDPVEMLARLPLSWSEIGMTYLRAYLLVPLLCAWPFLVARAVLGRIDDPGELSSTWINVFVVLAIANLVTVLLYTARRMRGYSGVVAKDGQRDH